MAESGDLVTPKLYGRPWFEKPVLYYWAAAKSFKLFGVSEAAARLPSGLCALLATLAMAWLAWRLYGAATARWLLLVMPTTVAMIGFSHAAATDMLFSGTLAVAMVSAASVIGLLENDDSGVCRARHGSRFCSLVFFWVWRFSVKARRRSSFRAEPSFFGPPFPDSGGTLCAAFIP